MIERLPSGRGETNEKGRASSGSSSSSIKLEQNQREVQFSPFSKSSIEKLRKAHEREKHLKKKDCCKMNEYLLQVTPESSYDLSEGPFIPNRTAWPTRKVDTETDLEAVQTPEAARSPKIGKNANPKGVDSKGRRQSYLWTPDAVDEGMYSTYLSQKIVFTKEYPYAKAIQVLVRKDRLHVHEEPKEMKKPKWRLQLCALLCCPFLGLLAILHNFRATNAFNLQNVKSQRDNMRFSRWFSVFAIMLGTITWTTLLVLRKHKKSQPSYDLSEVLFDSFNSTINETTTDSSSSIVH
ncbi:Oidioi.mRNA.OKI2018_I69.chr2.g4431.t1.cds [Oikopleura dioica]|uniref:Oidioi.mRNA.OKI2018_I69.chr2.g4431.t1.cds n=1 Tax=Oikopleura dioica TaxID=34765 RepID=A0ABN7T3X0_OIKDI|nr:Oidioi.mRNA.OKI2018_I69.chr2.g4431.t1.cds [Oikopleura dioica]